MRKKILLIGNPFEYYMSEFIKNVLIPLKLDIYIQADLSNETKYFSDFYSVYKINFIQVKKREDNIVFCIPFVGLLMKFFYNIKLLRNEGPFDFVQIQYVTLYYLAKALLARKKKSAILCASFFGSDLLCTSELSLKLEEPLLNKMDYLSADTYLMVEKYNTVYPKARKKLNVIYYGISLLEYIDRYDGNKTSCKLSFGIPEGKTVISIGYNGRWQQQHGKVLDVLAKISNKEKFFIILQMSYGIDGEEYISELIKQLDVSRFDYKILRDYLSMDNLAKLRVSTDIFINAQTTDAFCNSIKEYMYAKARIISASWLHYPEIDIFPLHINEFSGFDEIPALLEHPISEERLEWNKKRIKEESCWETCRNKWAEAYGLDKA